LFNTVWTATQSGISARKFTWLAAYLLCLMKKIHSWHGEMGEDTWSKISWNTKKTIWKGLLGRKNVSLVTTVEQKQFSSNTSLLRWHSLITVGFYAFPETEVSQSVYFPRTFILF
jgi:hypothetical protein